MANQKVLDDPKRHSHTAQGLATSTIHGDLLWVDGGWPGSCHEHELIDLAGMGGVLDDVEVASLLDRGFRGLAKTRQHWHAPGRDRRTIDRLSQGQRAYNRLQAGLRAGGAVDRPPGRRLGAAPLARAAGPRPGRLPRRRRTKSVFPTFGRFLLLALLVGMIGGHDRRRPCSRHVVAGHPAPAADPTGPLRRPAPHR